MVYTKEEALKDVQDVRSGWNQLTDKYLCILPYTIPRIIELSSARKKNIILFNIVENKTYFLTMNVSENVVY